MAKADKYNLYFDVGTRCKCSDGNIYVINDYDFIGVGENKINLYFDQKITIKTRKDTLFRDKWKVDNNGYVCDSDFHILSFETTDKKLVKSSVLLFQKKEKIEKSEKEISNAELVDILTKTVNNINNQLEMLNDKYNSLSVLLNSLVKTNKDKDTSVDTRKDESFEASEKVDQVTNNNIAEMFDLMNVRVTNLEKDMNDKITKIIGGLSDRVTKLEGDFLDYKKRNDSKINGLNERLNNKKSKILLEKGIKKI